MTASPGQFDPLAAVAELHTTVRKWTGHIPQNLPYVDLMFAFGFATLGDCPRAESLVEAARKVMQVPIPDPMPYGGDENKARPFVAATASNYLFKAFKYRVDQALADQPHVGPLSGGLLSELMELADRARAGPPASDHMLACYIIGRTREQFHILEPSERIDTYAEWTRSTNLLRSALTELTAVREPAELAGRIRRLFVEHQAVAFEQLLVLEEAFALAPRVGEAFASELLALLPQVVSRVLGSAGSPESPDIPRRYSDILERALFLTTHYRLPESTKILVGIFAELVRAKAVAMRFRLASDAMGAYLHTLKALRMREEVSDLLNLLETDVLSGAGVTDSRSQRASESEMWAGILRARLHVAGGYLLLGDHERVAPILAEGREALLAGVKRCDSKDFVQLARGYVAALSYGPTGPAITRITELFREMDPKKITNTWTTRANYSRFHLNLVEDTVFAVCRMDFAPPHVLSVGSP